MQEHHVSRVVVGCFSGASFGGTGSDQHDDMVMCVWDELVQATDAQSVDIDEMINLVGEGLVQLPGGCCAGGRRVLLDASVELLRILLYDNGTD